MKRAYALLAVIFGLVLPIGTLAFGWSYASIRETRLKEQRPMDARERAATASHFAWEMAGLTGLVLLLSIAGVGAIRAFRRAEELARQRALFVSAVSHELRTPLAALRLHAEMLAEGLVSEERKQQVFSELVTETARLTRLVENVLEASRADEGRRALRPVATDLVEASAAALEAQERTIEGRGFTVEGPSGAPVAALCDPAALSIIVVNLVDNAMKYAADHEPRTISVSVANEGDHAVLRVRDRGPGVPLPERERVFERFYRMRDAAEEHRPGTGLGLAIVRELAREHGGDARIVETDGPGTTVEVLLPTA
jgi:signal transduction histidine kinase